MFTISSDHSFDSSTVDAYVYGNPRAAWTAIAIDYLSGDKNWPVGDALQDGALEEQADAESAWAEEVIHSDYVGEWTTPDGITFCVTPFDKATCEDCSVGERCATHWYSPNGEPVQGQGPR